MRCDIDFFDNSTDFWDPTVTPNWLTELHDGDDFDWCNTQVPNLYQPDETLGHTGSNACCLIPKYGEMNYWLDEHNVRVFG